jgi:hypothetical protein
MINRIVIDKKGSQKTIKVNVDEIFDLKNIKGERWKDIDGYVGVYQISNYGRIKTFINKKINESNDSSRVEHILKVFKDNDGYFIIDLCLKNKSTKYERYLIHRLVAQSFLPNPESKKQVKHKNKIRTDNRAINLEWSSGSMKGRFGKDNHRSKKILQYNLKGNLIKEWESITQINKKLGFSVQNIRFVCRGEQEKCNGYIWRYKKSIKIYKIKTTAI